MTSKSCHHIFSRKVLLSSAATTVIFTFVLTLCLYLFTKYGDIYENIVELKINRLDGPFVVEPNGEVTSPHFTTENESQLNIRHRGKESVELVRSKRNLVYSIQQTNGENSKQSSLFYVRHIQNWDPHLEYEFDAFGRKFHIVLRQNELLYPNVKVTNLSNNVSIPQKLDVNVNCYYSGFLKDERESRVTLNLCNGMKGYIRSRTAGTYSIEPANISNNSSTTDHIWHRIDLLRSETSSTGKDYCATVGEQTMHYPDPVKPTFHADSFSDHRRKRSADEYTIELMVVLDKNVVDFHGADLDHYLIMLMKEVQELFRDNSVGSRIHVVPVKVVKLTRDGMFRDKSRGDRMVMLDLFCNWQLKINDQNDSSSDHHDSAVLITKDGVCSYERDKCDTYLGLAQIGAICRDRSYRSCAAVKDNGVNTVFTIAHELGHILNMPHDDDSACNDFHVPHESPKIMSKRANSETDQWSWSACSRHYLSEYLEQENVDCLYDSPFTSYDDSVTVDSPGKMYTLNQQCEKAFGSKGWTHCLMEPYICDLLWCKNVKKNLTCRTEAMQPWADGTPCGPGKWCQRKKCEPIIEYPTVHGGWGEWQPFSECSRECGGGIKKSFRHCNNPKNENGGYYCKGRGVRYESCNIQECSADITDFRAKQCADHNNSTTMWEPFDTKLEHDKCKLVCKEINGTMYKNFEKVIDGTRCDNDTTYGICVNGKCRITGCDHKLDSHTTTVDICGVCGGNNVTCRHVHKEFNREAKVGYTFIDKIPAGASKIDIQQFSFNGSADINYLALKDAETNVYILNGYHSVSTYPKDVIIGDLKLNYGGTHQYPERVWCPRTKSSIRLRKDLILEIFSSSNAQPFKIICQYAFPVPVSDEFKWEVTNEWSKCNNECYGQQEKIIRCVRKDTGSTVYSESCAGLQKPGSETKGCNEHCLLKWKVINQGECSSHCGPGVRKLTHRCFSERQDNHSGSQFLLDIHCSHIEKPAGAVACIGSCDQVRWFYSEWSPCSVTCGHGIQTRQAACVDEFNRYVEESLCSSEGKKIQNVCLMKDCPRWVTEPWSPCSVSCGQGEQKRRVWCVQNNKIILSDSCVQRRKPSHVKSCEMRSCSEWITGEWSQCSVQCGVGTVTRTVRCSASDERFCPAHLRPAQTENCRLYPCQDNNDIADATETYPHEYQWRPAAWSNCSSTCGKGVKRRHVKCYHIKSNSVAKDENCVMFKTPAATDACQERDCPQWKKSEWSSCSVTCGTGISIRQVWCEFEDHRVADFECKDTRPESSKSCDLTACPETLRTDSETNVVISSWRYGIWSECSVLCGGGTKVRNVVCLDSAGSTASNCIDHLRPSSSSPCNTHPCPDQVRWKYGDWSQCNQTCGRGHQRRQAQCVSDTDENVPHSYCIRIEQPDITRQCENISCSKIIYQWKSSGWSECSVSCGTGVYTRSVRCHRIDEYNIQNTEIVNDSYCTAERPMSKKECQKDECYTYKWIAGEWSECSVSCGVGMQKRKTECYKVNEQSFHHTEIVYEELCNKSSLPAQYQECTQAPCEDVHLWVPGPWGECHGPCGNKKKKRKLYCYHNGQNVRHVYCKNLQRPKRRKRCNQQKCDPVNCLDIKLKYKAGRDREYVMNILGRNISIYCYEMWSNHPKEYLTLAVGIQENYSEYYPKKLRDPDQIPCPDKTLRVARGLEESYSSAGRTVFRKLRLNVTSMQVIMNDYTFASTEGYRPIPVGQAGDCYSKRSCPLGSFSINVSGTGLRIAPSVQWEKMGNYATMDVKFHYERRKVAGRCGGYCSMCRPAHGLKLDVLPP